MVLGGKKNTIRNKDSQIGHIRQYLIKTFCYVNFRELCVALMVQLEWVQWGTTASWFREPQTDWLQLWWKEIHIAEGRRDWDRQSQRQFAVNIFDLVFITRRCKEGSRCLFYFAFPSHKCKEFLICNIYLGKKNFHESILLGFVKYGHLFHKLKV